jgi:hypothetical protein
MLIPFALVGPAQHGWLRGALVVLAAASTGAVAARTLAPRPPAAPAVLVAVPTLIPLPVPALAVDDTEETEVRGALASPHDGRLRVAWTAREVFVSRDGGGVFLEVLAAGGKVAGAVMDAAFDRHGRLHVLRGDGWLGVYDHDDPRRVERWVRVGTFHDGAAVTDDDFPRGTLPRLLVDRDAAVIGSDPAAPTRLLMARSDHRGGWQVATLFEDTSQRWDRTQIWSITPTANGRTRVVVHSWQAGECGGDDLFHELDVDTRRGTARTRRLDGYPP